MAILLAKSRREGGRGQQRGTRWGPLGMTGGRGSGPAIEKHHVGASGNKERERGIYNGPGTPLCLALQSRTSRCLLSSAEHSSTSCLWVCKRFSTPPSMTTKTSAFFHVSGPTHLRLPTAPGNLRHWHPPLGPAPAVVRPPPPPACAHMATRVLDPR